MTADIREVLVRAFLPGQRVITVSTKPPGPTPIKGNWRVDVHEATTLSRMVEPVEDLHAQVGFICCDSSSGEPTELAALLVQMAAVVADRAARGRMPALPEGGAVVMAVCENLLEGELTAIPQAHQEACLQTLLQYEDLGQVWVLLPDEAETTRDWPERILNKHPQAIIKRASHLSSFSGNLRAGTRRPHQAVAYFPVVTGNAAQLHEVQVTVSPLPSDRQYEEVIRVVGAASAGAQKGAVEAVLKAVRHQERLSARRWETVVHFPNDSVAGDSYQLALAVADRMARGREWPSHAADGTPGRVFATGAIDVGEQRPGRVKTVGEMIVKLSLLKTELRDGDTLLLPSAWADLPDVAELRAMTRSFEGPQLVFVEHVPGNQLVVDDNTSEA